MQKIAHMMSNESLREIAAFGVDLRTASPRRRAEAAIARDELNRRDREVVAL